MTAAQQQQQEDVYEESERRFTILYATQTGTAEDVAERIARIARRKRFAVRVCSLDQYDKLSLPEESLVLFVVSTTGAGDFPTSALSFWKFLLRSGLPSTILEDVTFATFGLGDTSYARYCWPVRKLGKRMSALGAHELIKGGEADDQHYLGIEGALQPWLGSFFTILDAILPLPKDVQPIPDDELLPPRIAVRVLPKGTSRRETNGDARPSSSKLPAGAKLAKLTRNERMTAPDHWQDVRAIEWEAEDGQAIDYTAGDVASLKPENAPEDVERFIKSVGWAEYADSMLELTATDPDRPLPPTLPSRLTLRQLLTTHLSPFSVPRLSFFEQIRHFAPAGHMEREKLDEFCTPGDGADDMYEYALRVRRTIAEVLDEFKAVRVPVEWACEVLPFMRERSFSIASSPETQPNKIQLAVALVSYKTRLKEPRRGICSHWLSTLPLNARFAFTIERGTLRLPPPASTPIILVGPGTGVAPMRSLIHSYLARQKEAKPEDVLLFLGVRDRKKDFIYGDEWRALAGETDGAEKRITYRVVASREGETKVYVQDRIREEGERVWEMIGKREAWFYISGSSGKMPEGVRAAVEDACVAHGGVDKEQAQRYINEMESSGRWQEECWS